MTKLSNNLGIDVAKRQLDYSFGKGLARGKVPNTPAGHAQIVELCRKNPALKVVCEATGGYEKALVKTLRKHGIKIFVVMPLKVRCLAVAEGLMAKTDAIDADKLALYARKIELRPNHVPGAHSEKLRELVECRRHLCERLVQLAGKRENAGERTRKLLDEESAMLKGMKGQIEQEIKACVAEDKPCARKIERMTQVKGVGEVVAATVLALMPEIGTLEDKTISALAGVAPYPNQSGQHERPRRIRGGRHQLRSVLYMAALAAVHYNPILRAFNQRLKDKGKHGRVRLVAVMRKLICLLNRICADPDFSLA